MDTFLKLNDMDLADVVVFEGVRAEKFVQHAFNFADKLIREQTNNRCYVVKVECRTRRPTVQYMKHRSLLNGEGLHILAKQKHNVNYVKQKKKQIKTLHNPRLQ